MQRNSRLISDVRRQIGNPEIAPTIMSLVLGCSKSEVLASKTISEQSAKKCLRMARAYEKGRPIAYATKKWFFYELPMYINRNVLIPRMDTEILVETVLKEKWEPERPINSDKTKQPQPKYNDPTREGLGPSSWSVSAAEQAEERTRENIFRPEGAPARRRQTSAAKWEPERPATKILDLCTGSGCIAVALAKHTKSQITASDISRAALRVARRNAEFNNVKIEFIHSNLFKSINSTFDIIVSNPPYIATKEIGVHDKTTLQEPRLALDGGPDGLNIYRRIIADAQKHLTPNGLLALEIGETQADEIRKLLLSNGYHDIKVVQDLNGLDRVVTARNR